MKTDNPPTPAEEKPRTWVIWKFALQNQPIQVLKIPKDARLLSVGAHEGEPCLWAMIEPQAEKESRVIEILRKSEAFGDYARTFIGTVQMPQLDLVLHVFEKTSPVFRARAKRDSKMFATRREADDWLDDQPSTTYCGIEEINSANAGKPAQPAQARAEDQPSPDSPALMADEYLLERALEKWAEVCRLDSDSADLLDSATALRAELLRRLNFNAPISRERHAEILREMLSRGLDDARRSISTHVQQGMYHKRTAEAVMKDINACLSALVKPQPPMFPVRLVTA